MADSQQQESSSEEQEGGAGWPGLLRYTLVSFLLLRDIFGYLIAGGVFVLVVICSGVLKPSWILHMDRWPVLIVLSYISGHLGAAIGYSILGILEWASSAGSSEKKPTQPSAEILYLHYLFPQLFIEYDRQSTMALFRIALGGNLLVAGLFVLMPCPECPALWGVHWLASIALLSAGAFFLYSGHSANDHIKNVAAETQKAAAWAAETEGRRLASGVSKERSG